MGRLLAGRDRMGMGVERYPSQIHVSSSDDLDGVLRFGLFGILTTPFPCSFSARVWIRSRLRSFVNAMTRLAVSVTPAAEQVVGGVFMPVRAMGIRLTVESFLAGRIPNVVTGGSEKEVFGVNAGPNVAMVAHLERVWDGSVVQLPREAVCAVADGRAFTPKQNLAVEPTAGSQRTPYPAGRPENGMDRAVLVDCSPKTLDRVASFVCSCHGAKDTPNNGLNPDISHSIGAIRKARGEAA